MVNYNMNTTLENNTLDLIYNKLKTSNNNLSTLYCGESGERQPVHTVYGGANLFKSTLASKLGQLALRSLDTYADNFVDFAKGLKIKDSHLLPSDEAKISKLKEQLEQNSSAIKEENFSAWLAYTVFERVKQKLANEPVEDFRIDFEDGYGNRPNEEEDAHAIQSAEQVWEGMQNNTLPPFIGIRIKPLTEELKHRSLRTLDLFLTKLSSLSSGKLPDNFVVTLPKVTIVEQVEGIIQAFEEIEEKTDIGSSALKLEIMIETTQSIIDPTGVFTIPKLIQAGKKRIRSAHFGTYDYTASCNITAAYQSISHPVCDFARHVMQVTLSNTGVTISDGATTIMPIGPHRAPKEGPALTKEQFQENKNVVYDAWRLHHNNIKNSLLFGFYQGWDLNPAQLPIRYATMYEFFLEGFDASSKRLKAFIGKAAQATLVGHNFDDAATGQGLLNYFLRALSCKAITKEEATNSGITLEELKSKSFVKIVANRS